MTRFGRIVVTAVVAVVLIGVTLIAAHYLRRSGEPPLPESSETAASTDAVVVETPGQAPAASGVGETAPAAAPGTAPVEDPAGEPAAPPAAKETEAAAEAAPAAPEAARPPAEPDGADLATAALAMVEDRPVVAQQRLSEAVRMGVSGDLAARVNEAIHDLADRLQFAGACRPGDAYSKFHTVQPGETLSAIGQKYLIPYPLVMKLNGLETSAIRAGQKLKVVQGPIHLEVLKGGFELRAWVDKVCVRAYPVALGRNNGTPEGTFNVKNKVRNPPYQPQHKPKSEYRDAGAPDNPLGTRWIDLGNHYGIHGTIEPESIGQQVSEGCIRMYNRHVEELYDLVVVGASKVEIRP